MFPGLYLQRWPAPILSAELLAAAIFAFTIARRHYLACAVGKGRDFLAASFLIWLIQALVLLALALTQNFNPQILAGVLLPPGSYFTRWDIVDIELKYRRLCEPLYVVLFLSSLVLYQGVRSLPVRRALWCSMFGLLLLATSQSLSLLGSGVLKSATCIWFGLSQLVIVPQLNAMYLYFRGDTLFADQKELRIVRQLLIGILLWFGCAGLIFGMQFAIDSEPGHAKPLVGAHYYSWFPENWSHGYIGRVTKPQIKPALGEYRSGTAKVFQEHLALGLNAGIDFFILDWWAQRSEVRRRVRDFVANPETLSGMKFAIQYESGDLKERGDKPEPGEDPNIIVMTPERAHRLASHWAFIARNYFKNPSYLRIDKRPVLFVYATRHIVGPVAEAISAARDLVRLQTGEEIFVVGDEAYFNVLDLNRSHGIHLLPEFVSNWARLSAFDAITVYNPYESTRSRYAGEEGAKVFLQEVEKMYAHYSRYARILGIKFIPGVIPGYNDRGVRIGADHYVLPRIVNGQSFFKENLERLGRPFLDREDPMLAITSWNEWNEGTQIEPSIVTEATNEDITGDGAFYTRHEYHQGLGCQNLDELSEFISSFNPNP